MSTTTIQAAAAQFGRGTPVIEQIGQGLIHHTYKVSYPNDDTIILQGLNQSVFKHPEDIIFNYRVVYFALSKQPKGMQIPRLKNTKEGIDFFIDAENNFWRATQFIPGSYAPALPADAKEVYAAAHCFAAFTNALSGLTADWFKIILPGFHDLSLRYRQFEDTIKSAHIARLLKATHVISELRDRTGLVRFYETMMAHPADYPTRIMHHDCKISNILFTQSTKAVICPIDLDTVMPGYFISDLGDMIRSMACTEDENSTAWEHIAVNKAYYDTLINAYLAGMGDSLTAAEKKNIHKPGLVLTYMQCLRYTTDFLQNDMYYKTTYPEQNLNRALNQLILLEKLEEVSG